MKKRNILYYLFLLLPFIDVITSILVRNTNISFTPGIIIKMILLLYLVYYCVNTSSKYKKLSLFLIISSFAYVLIYFIFKNELLDKSFIFKELQYLFKLIFFPISFGGLLCYIDEHGIDKKDIIKIGIYTLVVYAFLIFIPIILGISYTTYPTRLKGFIGLFYSGNEVSGILIILLSSSIYFINKNKYSFLILFPLYYLCLLIGTKVSTVGAIVIGILSLLLCIFSKLLRESIIYFILVIFMIVMASNSYMKYNYKILTSPSYINNNEKILVDSNNKKEIDKIKKDIKRFYNLNGFTKTLKPLLNGRDLLFANTLSIYNNSSNNILIGIGYSNTKKVNNRNIERLVEIDICDVFFHNGILGIIIVLLPFIVCLYYLIIKFKKINIKSVYLILVIGLMFGISCFAGHILICPSVSIYLVLLLIMLLSELGCFEKQKKVNEINILSLHLGYGGIEKAIVDQANMLSLNYKVKIICLYKLYDKIPFKLNNNVEIIYLSDLYPNKKEFKEAIKNKNILDIIKEGFKAIYILYKKKYLMIKYIYSSRSKVIISSRYYFTKLLSLYGDNETIKIAEEHCYHNNKLLYIWKLKYYLKNIDYLIPGSKYITDDYKLFFKNTKIRYIPLVIDYIPDKVNKLNNYNIVSVGRFSKEKGFKDLVDVYELVKNNNKKIRLTMVGDGVELDDIKNLSKEKKLDIIFKGFLNSEELKEVYSNVSLFVMTSFEESFGLVLIEAMSYGIPCIAFDSALGAKEIISNGNGILISNRNKVKMAQEIVNYFDKDKTKMSKKAREKALEYTYDKVSQEWYDFIKEIIGE